MEDDRHCDWKGKCKRKPYADVFPLTAKPVDEQHCPKDEWAFDSWSYLCFWHFQYARLRNRVRRLFGSTDHLGWGMAESTAEYLERMAEEAVWEAEYLATAAATEVDEMDFADMIETEIRNIEERHGGA